MSTYRRRRATWRLLPALVALVALAGGARISGAGTAFYYGEELPEELLQVYERVVVEPDALARAGADLAALARHRARLVAYVSVGELAPGARPAGFRDDWVLGHNPAWNSDVMDLTHPGWRRHVLERRVAALWRQGYRAFFLDTMDSFRLAGLPQGEEAAQVAALIEIVRAIARRHPGAEILINRGFEILPAVADVIAGVAAESLHDRWDAAQGRYVRVPERDRAWLAHKLREVRDQHGLPVVVIDYRPPGERAAARATAQRIAALGFTPWVTDASLTSLGVGAPEIVPRRVLVLYDGERERLEQAAAHRLLAPVLEHQGLVPVLLDVSQDALPREPLPGRYAGVVTWFHAPLGRGAARYRPWLLAQLDAGVRVAMLGHIGDSARAVLDRLGLRHVQRGGHAAGQRGALTLETSALVGFEAEPATHRWLGPGLVAADSALRVHLRVRDAAGPVRDAVITAPWGGLALAPHLLRERHGGELAWVIDPFAFVREALALEPIPIPDVTTENGHRLLLVHVSARGAGQRAELRGTPRARDGIRQLLARHQIPHSTDDPLLARGLAHVRARASGLVGPGGAPTRLSPSLTRLVPMARPRARSITGARGPAADEIDVLWPVADEDGLVTAGSDPGLSFRRVRETLALTDRPRRLTPLALQYSARLGATPAGLRSLEAVYRWIAAQETFPVHAWEYADRVRDFRRLVIARDPGDGSFVLAGLGALRTVRLPPALGWPELARSPAVVAVHERAQGRYVTVAGGERVRLALGARPPDTPVVIGSNARVLRFDVRAGSGPLWARVRARGHAPVSLLIDNLPRAGCALIGPGLRVAGRPAALRAAPRALRFDTAVTDTGEATLRCPAAREEARAP